MGLAGLSFKVWRRLVCGRAGRSSAGAAAILKGSGGLSSSARRRGCLWGWLAYPIWCRPSPGPLSILYSSKVGGAVLIGRAAARWCRWSRAAALSYIVGRGCCRCRSAARGGVVVVADPCGGLLLSAGTGAAHSSTGHSSGRNGSSGGRSMVGGSILI